MSDLISRQEVMDYLRGQQKIVIIEKDYGNPADNEYGIAKEQFAWLWDSTIKKTDLDRYGWDADPWVWVIEFERCEKPEI